MSKQKRMKMRRQIKHKLRKKILKARIAEAKKQKAQGA
jgi:hypothetical protein